MKVQDKSRGWFTGAVEVARTGLAAIFPALGAVAAAKDFVSEQVAQRIRNEAMSKAQALIRKTHHDVMRNILWQNGLLVVSILPVYLFKSPWPFYGAYAAVLAYTLYSLYNARALLMRVAKTRSLTGTLALEVREAIDLELTQVQMFQRVAVEWLGPDLDKLSLDVAR
ncbi:unnamed protein product, partial [marine sediment metagenome]